MKNIDSFVKVNFWERPKTLKEIREEHEKLTKQIRELEEKKKKYKEMLSKDNLERGMSFKDKVDLYNNSIGQNNYTLANKLLVEYDDLGEYIELCQDLMELKDKRGNIISDNVSFNDFGGEERFDERCLEQGHCLIMMNEDLVCIYCGATTKEYSLSKEDLEFLIHCAKCKNILLEEVTKEDLSFLEVLKAKGNYYRSEMPSLDDVEEDEYMSYLTSAEEYYLEVRSEISEIKKKIRKAHILDKKIYLDRTGLNEEDAKKSYLQLVQEWKIDDVGVTDPRYLSGERLKHFQNKLEAKLSMIEQSSSTNRNRLLEECMVMKYEISILTGISIPELLTSTTNELEENALTVAYFNLSSQTGRINSGYFESEEDASWYDCVTACPKINEKILKMGLIQKLAN
ncbi:MAG: hypothetical protein WDA21_01225 [Bacilli bacterium]